MATEEKNVNVVEETEEEKRPALVNEGSSVNFIALEGGEEEAPSPEKSPEKKHKKMNKIKSKIDKFLLKFPRISKAFQELNKQFKVHATEDGEGESAVSAANLGTLLGKLGITATEEGAIQKLLTVSDFDGNTKIEFR